MTFQYLLDTHISRSKQYNQEFKTEIAKQITGRNYPVPKSNASTLALPVYSFTTPS